MTDTPHILFHRPTPWTSEVECSTKVLAKTFARDGFKASYLEAPLDIVHLLKGHFKEFQAWRDSPRIDASVQVLKTASAVPVRDVWPLNTKAASASKYRLTYPRLDGLLKRSNYGKPDLIWTTVPGSVLPLKRIFPNAKIAFHVIDFYPAYRGDAVKPLEVSDYSISDHTFVIGSTLERYLLDELAISDRQVTNLGQGVKTARFNASLEEPEEILNCPHPRAIWVGVMAKGDEGLFRRTVQVISSLGGSVILVGPCADWARRLGDDYSEIVRILPAQSAEKIPPLLVHCDIGLMLYDRSKQDIYKGQNPLKLYEYAAAGLGIISTHHDEFDTLSPPIKIVSTESEVEEQIKALAATRDLQRTAMIKFASKFSWQSIQRRILSTLKIGNPAQCETQAL